jgi:hypothetical protein
MIIGQLEWLKLGWLKRKKEAKKKELMNKSNSVMK